MATRNPKPFLRPSACPALPLLDLVRVVIPIGGVKNLVPWSAEKFFSAAGQCLDRFSARSLISMQARDGHDFCRTLHVERIDTGLIDRRAHCDDTMALIMMAEASPRALAKAAPSDSSRM